MRKLSAVLLVSIVVLAIHVYAKDHKASGFLLHARYVALGYETAGGFVGEWDTDTFLSAKILPADRQALVNVSDAIKRWNRYVITIDPRQADLLIAVRAGRIASTNGGVIAEDGSIDPSTMKRRMPGIAIGTVVDAEAGPPRDYLAVLSRQ